MARTDRQPKSKAAAKVQSKAKKKSPKPSDKGRGNSVKAVGKKSAAKSSAPTKDSAKATPKAASVKGSKTKVGAMAGKASKPKIKSSANSKTTAQKSSGKKLASNSKPASKRPGAQNSDTTKSSAVKANKAKLAATQKSKTAKPPKRTANQAELDLEVVVVEKSTLNGRRILRPKFFPEYPTEKPFGHQSETPEIPAVYGHDRLVIMPKDPEWLFTYWELTPQTVEDGWHEREHGHQYQEALKLSWQPHELFEPNYVFLPVEFTARKWYLTIPGDASKSFQVEIGWLGENGHFISLLQSETETLPESWVQTRDRILREGKISAFTAKNTVKLGASENAVISESRGLFQLENLSSGIFSSSSLALANRNAPASNEVVLMETTHIEIAGSLPKGSRIRMMGQEFAPNPKGQFKIAVDITEPTLHLEVVSSEGQAQFFAYDLSTPAT